MTLAVDRALEAFAGEVGREGPVAARGGGTRWELGGPLVDGARLVTAPEGVLEHRPEEMTVRVRAGTTVADLHEAIGAAGQISALPDRGGTVGGALAVGENDLLVLARGQVRTSVLQVRYVSAEGKVVTAGGPTVKNVSGYDVPRLLVGSLGTLGLIAEVVLRVNPVPPVTRWLVAAEADPFSVPDIVLRPAAVLWDGTQTWVALAGHGVDVDADSAALARLGSWQPAGGPPPLPSKRWSLRPADLRQLDAATTGAFVACVGVGTVFATKPQPLPPADPAIARLAARVKQEFDPTGRLGPGRDPYRRHPQRTA